MSASSRIRRGVVVAALSVAATAGLGVGTAQAEPYHHSTMNKQWFPWNTPSSQGWSQWPIPSGASVRMICWNTGAYRDGTAKWFLVERNASPFTRGYVPANSVGNQWTTSPHC